MRVISLPLGHVQGEQVGGAQLSPYHRLAGGGDLV
jgi:hypothetical protein